MVDAINVINDELVEVRQLADKTFGQRISPATLYRWIQKGANGHRLLAVKVGRKWFTTSKAFQKFFEAQTAAATATSSSTPAEREDAPRALDVSDEELRACGLR